MERTSKITVLIIGAAIVGGIALALVVVGILTKNWITVSSSSSSLQARVNNALRDATFIESLIGMRGANQTQVETIIFATIGKVKEELNRDVGRMTYDLFDKTPSSPNFKLPQALILAGMASVFVGVLLATASALPSLRRVLRAIPLLFLIAGPILITIGYIFYTKLVMEDFGSTSVVLGYSFILVIIASIVGYIAAVFFAVTILHSRQSSRPQPAAVIVTHPIVVSEKQPMVITTSF